jgi:hypothetical protein
MRTGIYRIKSYSKGNHWKVNYIVALKPDNQTIEPYRAAFEKEKRPHYGK